MEFNYDSSTQRSNLDEIIGAFWSMEVELFSIERLIVLITDNAACTGTDVVGADPMSSFTLAETRHHHDKNQ